ncbi:MAG: EVE domain-containing protein [Chloroflexales bacterium]|nr:EVE domain-containing protein [Chloroflexales bacterium]
MQYWINTISRAHVLTGVGGGFTQADHGRDTRLRQLRRGDWLVFYSPRTEFRGGEPLQAFTAMGQIADDAPYQVEMTLTFHPGRRAVTFVASREAPIQPLIPGLSFIEDKQRWGFPFRRGLFRVERADFAQIAAAMGVALDPAVT